MKGHLYVYARSQASGANLCTFLSGHVESQKCIVFITGLTGGWLDVPYVAALERRLRAEKRACLVQAVLSSSYLGYGGVDLRQDARELWLLLAYLRRHHGKKEFVLMGHSTGCQDILWMLRNGPPTLDSESTASDSLFASIRGCILQAPVSDREYLQTLPNYEANLQLAQQMMDRGQEKEWMPRDTDVAAITAERYLSLASRGGDDDMFSWDFTEQEWQAIHPASFLHSSSSEVPKMILVSGKDEYVPACVNIQQQFQNLIRWIPGSDAKYSRILEGANHAVTKQEDIVLLCDAVLAFLCRCFDESTM